MAVTKLAIVSTPYTYVLEWTKLGKRYIGARWAAGCHPSDLWSSYFTSSKYVAEFVKENGAPDIILIDQEFLNPRDAIERENILLKQFNAAKNPDFLNKAIGGVFDPNDPAIRKRIGDSQRGKKHTPEWIAWVTEFHRNRKRSPETCQRIRDALIGKKLSPEHCESISRAKKGMVGIWLGKKVTNPIHLEQRRLVRLGKTHSQETKQKMSLAHRGRKYPSITCPYCGKTGKETGMKSWHFDYCKNNPSSGERK